MKSRKNKSIISNIEKGFNSSKYLKSKLKRKATWPESFAFEKYQKLEYSLSKLNRINEFVC